MPYDYISMKWVYYGKVGERGGGGGRGGRRGTGQKKYIEKSSGLIIRFSKFTHVHYTIYNYIVPVFHTLAYICKVLTERMTCLKYPVKNTIKKWPANKSCLYKPRSFNALVLQNAIRLPAA